MLYCSNRKVIKSGVNVAALRIRNERRGNVTGKKKKNRPRFAWDICQTVPWLKGATMNKSSRTMSLHHKARSLPIIPQKTRMP